MAEIVPVRPEAPAEEVVRRAAAALRRGETIALPTDTIYGLCARARDAGALGRLFSAKGRPEEKGVPVLVGGPEQLDQLAEEIPPGARALIDAFWPGPLTLILPARADLPRPLTGGPGGGVAVRLPDQALCRALARAAGPFAATSANLSDEPPLESAAAIAAAMGDRISLVLDGGPPAGPTPSALVDARGARPALLRRGGLSFKEIEAVWEGRKNGG